MGSQMQQIAISWHVFELLRGQTYELVVFGRTLELNASAIGLGSLGLARVIPIIIFALLGGLLADARDRRTLLILLFAVWLRWLPPSGFTHLWENPVDAAKHLVLPGVTLGVNLIGTVARQTRSAMLEVLGQDYIRTARAKGLGQRVVLTRHALRNAMLPVVTVLGLQFANLLGGTVIIEQVFAIPGVGRLTLGAVFAQDLPVVQGAVLLAALATLARLDAARYVCSRWNLSAAAT